MTIRMGFHLPLHLLIDSTRSRIHVGAHAEDGRYGATRRIKATEQGQSTKVIALTASAFEEDRHEVWAAGCDDFVRKPFRRARAPGGVGTAHCYGSDWRQVNLPPGDSYFSRSVVVCGFTRDVLCRDTVVRGSAWGWSGAVVINKLSTLMHSHGVLIRQPSVFWIARGGSWGC